MDIADSPVYGVDFGQSTVTNFEPIEDSNPNKGGCTGKAQSITVHMTSNSDVIAGMVSVAAQDDPQTPLASATATVTGGGVNWSMTASWILPPSLKGKSYYIQLHATNASGTEVAWIGSIHPAR